MITPRKENIAKAPDSGGQLFTSCRGLTAYTGRQRGSQHHGNDTTSGA